MFLKEVIPDKTGYPCFVSPKSELMTIRQNIKPKKKECFSENETPKRKSLLYFCS